MPGRRTYESSHSLFAWQLDYEAVLFARILAVCQRLPISPAQRERGLSPRIPSTQQNALASLIRERMSFLGLKPAQVVRLAGYRSVNGGLKALNKTFATGRLQPHLGQGLAKALQISDRDLSAAIQANATELEVGDVWRRHQAELVYIREFKPYVLVWFDAGPPWLSSTTLLGGIYPAAFIDTPVDAMSGLTDRSELKRLVDDHYERWSGKFPIYGRIRGYCEFLAPSPSRASTSQTCCLRREKPRLLVCLFADLPTV